ncbi:hypothetical protein N2152v2_004313 [Parachlorella kessleri]
MERPTGSSHISFTLAAITGAAGVSGYAKSSSVPSLVAGLGIAATFAAGGALINSGRSDLGHPTNLVASLALVAAMTPRAIRTRKLWPAGAMALLGWASSGYEAKKTLEWLG